MGSEGTSLLSLNDSTSKYHSDFFPVMEYGTLFSVSSFGNPSLFQDLLLLNACLCFSHLKGLQPSETPSYTHCLKSSFERIFQIMYLLTWFSSINIFFSCVNYMFLGPRNTQMMSALPVFVDWFQAPATLQTTFLSLKQFRAWLWCCIDVLMLYSITEI